jgi:hypothetical protein
MKNILLPTTLVLFAVLSALSSPIAPEQPEKITITAKPITRFGPDDPARGRSGALEFRGGLVLSSTYEHFGGISALRVQTDGSHFIALSDRTYWLRGRIVYSGNRPSGIEDSVMAPVLNSKGKPATNWDTESIAQDGRFLYVGIEGLNAIMRFDYARKGVLASAQPIPVPRGVKSLPGNKGLEALVFVPKQFRLGRTIVAFSERGLDAAGNLEAFLLGGPTPGSFSVKRTEEFDISDAAILPGGDILILERKFFLLEGVTVRIRRIRQADLKPGAVVDGQTLFEANGSYEIDNLEALSVHRTAGGELILTMMSDDNFSMIQRTLLLQFALAEK